MSEYVEKLFISVGETGAFFTLRQSYMYLRSDGFKEVRSYHHCNLSQDADQAVEKAIAFSEAHGVPLGTNAETLKQEMRDIQRETAEQTAARKKREEEKLAQWAIERKEYEEKERARKLAMIAEGKYAMGQYEGKEFAIAPPHYIKWLISSVEDFEESSMLRAQAQAVAINCQHLLLPVPTKQGYVGDIASRITITGTVVMNIEKYGEWGFTHLVQIVTTDGQCVMSRGAFNPKVGEKITAKATIKAHQNYKGQDQTWVLRVVVQKRE